MVLLDVIGPAQLRSALRRMRTLAIIVGLAFVTLASFTEAQTGSTNLLTTEQALKVASRLKLGMREKDATILLERGGLRCDLVRLGGGFHWANYCELAGKRSLALEFKKSPGKIGHWEDGLLQAAYITAGNGIKVVSISLTNAP